MSYNRSPKSKYVSAGRFNVSSKKREGTKVIPDEDIDYKNVALLKTFLSPGSRICSRRMTRLSAKQQRQMRRQVKLAQFLSLLAYCDRHKR